MPFGTGDLQTRHLTGAEPRLSSSGEMPMGSPLQRKEISTFDHQKWRPDMKDHNGSCIIYIYTLDDICIDVYMYIYICTWYIYIYRGTVYIESQHSNCH